MVTNTSAIFEVTRSMEKAPTATAMAANMWVNGEMAAGMGKALTTGMMAANI